MKFVVYLVVLLVSTSALAGSYDDFFRAVVGDDGRAIRSLVDRGFDPNAVDPDGQPAIIRALQAESSNVALLLARLPATEVDIRNRAGETPLMIAALKGDSSVADALLARGASIDLPGWAPLHYAAAGNSLVVLKQLLARGAPVEARAPNGRTALMMAALHGSEELVDALLAAGASPALRDKNGTTAADLAASSGRDWLARKLAQHAAAKR